MAKKVDAEEAARAAAAYFGSMGGRKSRANMTPEARREAARKAGIARARKAGQTIHVDNGCGYCGRSLTSHMGDFSKCPRGKTTGESARSAQGSGTAVDVGRPAVLKALAGFKRFGAELDILAAEMKIPSEDKATRDRLKNTLSSLRTAGKVQSVALAGSKRKKLWRVVK